LVSASSPNVSADSIRHLLAAFTCASVVLAGCGGEGGGQAGIDEPVSGQSAGSVNQTTTIDEGGRLVTTTPGSLEPGRGRAVARSDVTGIADSALTSGSVLFVPGERAPELAVVTGLDRLSNVDSLRHAEFALVASALDALDGTAVAIDGAGRFAVDVPNGLYVVCLADTFPDHTQAPPYSVVGCSRVELPDGARLVVSFGEGGVETTIE
jgi:hypothetical protein